MSIDFNVSPEGIASITINRPESLNAMDADHYRDLSRAWCAVRDDPKVRVAIVTGAGTRSFTVGADIKTFLSAPTDISEMWMTQRDQLLNRGLEVWKPVICAVNGFCLGGGMTLMLATDIRVAVPHATFSLAEVKRGVVAGNGGTQRVLDQLPYAIGMEMLLTAESIDAETALRYGLINKIAPAADLLDVARGYALKIAANAPLAVQAAKELAIRSRDVDRATGLRMESVMNRMLMTTYDAKEGPSAFSAKRTPNFEGR
jgi:E-phenylitaconyl-CoA hydratase